MDFTPKRKKAVNWCSQENDLIIHLFLEEYNSYYLKFSDGSKKGMKAVRDSLHEKWAEQLTNLRFAKRTPAQVAEKIKKSIIVTRKFINNNGVVRRNGRIEDLPPHLKPLEKKLREEYNKQSNDSAHDLTLDESMNFLEILRNVKEEAMSPLGGVNADEGRGTELELDVQPNGNDNIEAASLSGLSHVSTVAQVFDPLPPVAPVTPFKNSTILPSVLNKNRKRVIEEDLIEDINTKRHRLVDAEMELIQRKRYLLEMKIKYWEGKIKRPAIPFT